MKQLDNIRILANRIRRDAESMESAADFLREPKPDDTEQMIARINKSGWHVMICQCIKLPLWYVCMYRGDATRVTDMTPTATAALQAAVNMVCT